MPIHLQRDPYHLLFSLRHVDGAEWVTHLLDLRGTVKDRHASLLDVVELKSKLQLKGYGVGDEDTL